jgi:putative peptide zinc metalloprotease protein
VVKDPVSLRYFRFGEEEYSILQLLDGSRGLNEIAAQFQQRHAPYRLPTPRLEQFIANLHRNGLLISDGPGQSRYLLRRRAEQRREQLAQTFSNPLAIRFSGIDPQPLLEWLYPWVRCCFTPWFLVACFALVVYASLLVLSGVDELRARLPDFGTFVSVHNLIWLAAVIAATKVLHEFGHALTCRHFGGECHEMGMMLLVFTPCLYCNVTDAWILNSRRQRIAISAAGIIVEVVLAAVATILWWHGQPGLFHDVCLKVMMVCAVGTLLLNGNPLMRYDGYFVLSDLLESANLWQDSRQVVGRAMWRLLCGVDLPDSVTEDRRGMLALFALSSMFYRLVVVLGIVLFLYKALVPVGLQLLAYGIAASTVMGFMLRSLLRIRRMITDPTVRGRIRWPRVFLSSSLLMAAVALFFLIALPARVTAPAVLELQDASRVYVTVKGTLVSAVTAGQGVHSGETLARLEDAQLVRQVTQHEDELARLEQRVRSLDARAVRDPEALAQLATVREMAADIRQRLTQLQGDLDSLTLRAPTAGTVFPPPKLPAQREPSAGLPSWSGTPLDKQNLGCTLERGSLFCLVGEPSGLRSVLFVDESQIDLVRVGQQVQLRFDTRPGTTLRGRVKEIAGEETQFVPPELAVQRDLPNRQDRTGIARPLKTSYQVQVVLDQPEDALLLGARGRARIIVAPQTLARRLYRAVRQTLDVAR